MYRARFLLAGALIGFAAALLAALALLPSYLVLRAGAMPDSGNKTASSVSEDREAIARAQVLLREYDALVASTTPSGAIELALAKKSARISIDHITYTRGQPSTIALTGRADKPVDIDTYRKALFAEQLFESVTVPVGDLVGTKDGNFSMTIQGNF